ncbi:MAG: Hsp20/alpha crystallin family protein [Haliscomenobacter sp.]|jgi:HSP20 family protein|nr:Hsp20/alpha crystallin family protein [Haliscomenobacter sp.]MBK8654367.1 Hsp20/alpha crystallin family protein [Haliscomenobacter sp.]MBP9076649.1 Hsp20/alpha crystallin family protein [Haliscomenobacter sp.]MBV6427215.1 hypothetical protein [Haliscomenobacter sp.]
MYGHCKSAGWKSAWAKHRHAHAQGMHGRYVRPKYNIPVNIEETDTSFEIYLYAAGFDKDNIRISVSGDVLYVNGQRDVPEDFKPNFIRQEFPVKHFEKSFVLGDSIDTENIKAKQEGGALVLSLPKRPEAQTRSWEVDIV